MEAIETTVEFIMDDPRFQKERPFAVHVGPDDKYSPMDPNLSTIPFAGNMDFFRLGARTPSPLGGARGHPGHPIKTPVSHIHLSTTPKTIYRV